ncbi:MAG TPA: hypothetical protein VK629_13760 [Steroidobacteraceae bacterium]|nr:hypothetical protein [Steroidobacteraceae bacterium]
MTTLSLKLGLTPQARSFLHRAPPAIAKNLSSSGARFAKSFTGSFHYIHAFFVRSEKLDARFPKLRQRLAVGGALWISWPKSGKLESDLTLTKIIKIGYSHGLVESKTIAVDAAWSAIKFTHPKKGKKYKNSYGKLPSYPSSAHE